jgi:predicted ATP-grasp superfamily ATP-dependent carboligase
VSDADAPPAFASKYCDETERVADPAADPLGYRDDLLALARRPEVETIYPLREPDVHLLSKYRDDFAEEVATLWPDFETLRVAHDRRDLFELAADLDVPIPETTPLSEIDDWERERIVKARYALLTHDYVPEMGENELESPPKTLYLEPGDTPDVAAIQDAMGHDPIAQSYVEGTEFTVRALYEDGEPVLTTQKRMLRGYKYPRGPSVGHESVWIPELERLTTRLLSALDWHGMASVGYLRDAETGEFKLLEINPRYPASLPMDCHAGVEYPYYYWALATDDRAAIDPDYRIGTTSHLLRGELVHLYSVLFEDYPLATKPSLPRTVREMAASFVQHPRFDLLSTDDPGPFVRDTLNTVRSTLGN